MCRFRQLSPDGSECGCMKAVVLFTPGENINFKRIYINFDLVPIGGSGVFFFFYSKFSRNAGSSRGSASPDAAGSSAVYPRRLC